MQDTATACLREMGDRGLRGAHAAHQVDIDRGGPAFLVIGAAETRGIVDQDVDAAEGFRRILDIAAHRRAVAEIAGRRMHLAAECLQVCRSEEHTSELQSLMRNSYAVFCLKQKK